MVLAPTRIACDIGLLEQHPKPQRLLAHLSCAVVISKHSPINPIARTCVSRRLVRLPVPFSSVLFRRDLLVLLNADCEAVTMQ